MSGPEGRSIKWSTFMCKVFRWSGFVCFTMKGNDWKTSEQGHAQVERFFCIGEKYFRQKWGWSEWLIRLCIVPFVRRHFRML